MSLPVAQYPEIVPPTIQVTTSYPGGSAEVVANTVGIPIEQAVNGVESSIYMQSTSASDGSYTLTVTFNVGTDLNTSLSLVQNAVNERDRAAAAGGLRPGRHGQEGVDQHPDVRQPVRDDDRYDGTFLTNYATINLQHPLARLPGVAARSTSLGAGTYSMRIWLDANKMQSFGLTHGRRGQRGQESERPGGRRPAGRSAACPPTSCSRSR